MKLKTLSYTRDDAREIGHAVQIAMCKHSWSGLGGSLDQDDERTWI